MQDHIFQSSISPLVTISGHRAVTTSKAVADFFGKRHDNVMRDVENLRKDLPESHLLNFEEITYYHTFAGGTLQILQRCIALNAMQIPHELIPMFITLTGTRDRTEFERLALKTLLESTEGASGSFEA